MPVTFPGSSSQNVSRSQQLLHRLQNSVIYPPQIYPHTSSSLHSYMPSQLNLPKAPNSDLPEKLPETSSSTAAPPSTRFIREETRLLVSVWEEEFVGFTCKKRVKQEEWEHLSTVYNEKAEYYLFSSRTAAQLESKIKNLKDQYKKLKDSLHKTGEGFDKDKINDFPFFETFERLLGGKESYNLKHVLDPTRQTEEVKKPFRSIENLLSDETRSDEDESAGPIPLKACNEKRKPSRKTNEDKDCENEKPKEFKPAKRQRRKSKGQGSSPDKDEDKFMQFMIESREKDQEMFSKIMELTEKSDQRSAEVTLQLVQAIGKMVQNSKG